MKKIAFSLLLLTGLFAGGFSQTYPVTLNVIALDSLGNPAPGVWVYLNIPMDSLCTFSALDSAQTNAMGQATITIQVSGCVANGYMFAYYFQCGNSYQSMNYNYGPNPTNNNFTMTIISCPPQGPATTMDIMGWVIDSSGNPGQNTIRDADVYLIVYDSALTTLTAVDTTQVDTNGYFEFLNIPAAQYLVKAALLPASPVYAARMPTYYNYSLFWNTANNVGPVTTTLYLDMIPGVNPGGPGFIGGLVSQGANKRQGPGDPMQGIDVLLLDINNNPIAWNRTNALGEFSFPSLAYGTYKIWPEVAGKVTTPILVTLSASSPSASQINVHVNTTEIIASIFSGPETLENFTAKFYPNPVSGSGTISIESDEISEANLRLIDLNGKLIQEKTLSLTKGENRFEQDFSTLPAGMYYIELKTDEGSLRTRILNQ